ncbi:MnhB domain-containing protein [Natrinema altunense]|uniref:Monovalent cation/H+ antiporter subunit B n=2 Tax=Natrinema altunense TaxID=222984 RepID=L9ZIG8_NATA2|nr:MnhB domain-containing protein [Natrinema altunense]ELY86290.1 monovalent cation/H+ antiporter subunit B [Natrinema altunense JCM 12890]RZH66903.1 cation:proton antiporter [Natrinema altunense]
MSQSVDDTYTESQVIMTAVKIIAPFTLTYGLFMTFHGGDAPGGGFQGGTVVGVTVLMLAFAFGIEPTRRWLRNSFLVGIITGGVVLFGAIGLAMIALGGNFLEFAMLKEVFHIKAKWGLEAIEIGGISLIVTGTIISLFFTMAAGFSPERPSGTGGRNERGESAGAEVSDDD